MSQSVAHESLGHLEDVVEGLQALSNALALAGEKRALRGVRRAIALLQDVMVWETYPFVSPQPSADVD